MNPRPPSSAPDSAFDHPAFGPLYARVLRDVADRRLQPVVREAAARALAFLLRERFVDAAVVGAVLTAIHTSIDLVEVVRTLLLGLRDALGDDQEVAAWTPVVANRALHEGHLPSFIGTMRLLVELRGYCGTVTTRWRLALVRAAELPELAPRVLTLVRAYARRFPTESWPRIQQARRKSTIASLRRRVTVEGMREARES